MSDSEHYSDDPFEEYDPDDDPFVLVGQESSSSADGIRHRQNRGTVSTENTDNHNRDASVSGSVDTNADAKSIESMFASSLTQALIQGSDHSGPIINIENGNKALVTKKLDEVQVQLDKYPFLQLLEENTGVKKMYIFLSVLLCLILFVFFGLGLSTLCFSFGVIPPLYFSFKSIERKRVNLLEIRRWLMYWVVFGVLIRVEAYASAMLSWLPLYHPFKFAFLLWCLLPYFDGSSKVYEWCLRPLLKKHEQELDQTAADVKETICASFLDVCESLQDTARRWVSEATEALTEQYAMRQRGREMEREKEGPSLNHTGVVEGTSRASAECGGAGGDYGHRNDVSTVAERGLDESESKMTHTEEMMKGKHVK